jgi:hypothetical protein
LDFDLGELAIDVLFCFVFPAVMGLQGGWRLLLQSSDLTAMVLGNNGKT